MTHAHFIQKFVMENFGREYHPVLHGRCETLSPLTLVVKRKTKWYKWPKLVVMAKLVKYVASEEEQAYRDLVKSKLQTIKKRLEKTEVDKIEELADSHELKLEVDVAGVTYLTKDLPGDLVLGQLDEEYFEDPDVREILKKTTLDEEKMKPFEDADKIYLVTSVVYSEKFKIKGKPKRIDSIDAHVNPGWLTNFLLSHSSKLSARSSTTRSRSPRIERKVRGPLLFVYNRVSYDKENCALRLSDQEFVGKSMIKARGLQEKKQEYEIIGDEDEDKEMNAQQEIYCIHDLNAKMEVVQQFLLSTERGNRKHLLSTYVEYFKEVLEKEIKSFELKDEPTREQAQLLHGFGFAAVRGTRVFEASKKNYEDIRDYGTILHYVDGLPNQQWNAFLELCENAGSPSLTNTDDNNLEKTKE